MRKGFDCDFGIQRISPAFQLSRATPFHQRASHLAVPSCTCDISCPTHKHGLSSPSTTRYSTPHASSIEPSPKLPSQSIPMLIDTPSDRLLELRLMHNYMSISSTSFSSIFVAHESAGKGNALFTNWSTRVALKNPSTMDALLGFSAMTLRKLDPYNSSLAQASHRYMTRALASQAATLRSGVCSNNAEALFIGAILIAYTSVCGRQYLGSPETERASLPFAWFEPWKGVRTIYFALEQDIWLSAPEVNMLLQFEMEFTFYPISRERGRAPSSSPQPNPFAFLLEGLDESNTDAETLMAYHNGLHHLRQIYDKNCGLHPFRFTSSSEPRFLQLLQVDDPRALTILGYFFMLFRNTERLWWLPEPTETMFGTVMEKLPEEWRPRMDWAVREFYRCNGGTAWRQPADISSAPIPIRGASEIQLKEEAG